MTSKDQLTKDEQVNLKNALEHIEELERLMKNASDRDVQNPLEKEYSNGIGNRNRGRDLHHDI